MLNPPAVRQKADYGSPKERHTACHSEGGLNGHILPAGFEEWAPFSRPAPGASSAEEKQR